MRKFLSIFLVLICAFTLNMSFASATYAEKCQGEFLGIPAWYNNLECENGNIVSPDDTGSGDIDELKIYVWTIISNVGSMITGTAAYVAVALVAYGGFLYLTSAGNPSSVMKSKKTITNSIIGLIICATARTITTAISALLNNAAANASDMSSLLSNILNPLFVWAGILGVIFIVIAGVNYTTAAGDSAKIVTAKKTIVAVAIGLIIILTAASIVNIVLGAL